MKALAINLKARTAVASKTIANNGTLFTKKQMENTEKGYVKELDRLCIHVNLPLSSIQFRMIQLHSKKWTKMDPMFVLLKVKQTQGEGNSVPTFGVTEDLLFRLQVNNMFCGLVIAE